MKVDSCSADPFGQIDLVVNKPGIPRMARLSPQLRHRLVAGGATALLAFAVGLLVAAFGARAADEPARPLPVIEQAGSNSDRVQPTAEQFAPPYQPSSSDSRARYVDELYRQLIGQPPATGSGSHSGPRSQAAPSNDAAGSVRRWVSLDRESRRTPASSAGRRGREELMDLRKARKPKATPSGALSAARRHP